MIIQEMKKIFQWKRVFMLFIMGILFYLAFFRQNIGFSNYESEKVNLFVTNELMEKYGNMIDENVYTELKNGLNETEESKIDLWIKGNQEFQKNQIYSYEELIMKVDTLSDDVAKILTGQVNENFTDEEQMESLENIWRTVYRKNVVDSYEQEVNAGTLTSYYSEIPKEMEKRISERNKEEIYSLMPDMVMRKYLMILPDFTIFLLMSMILLVVPYSVKDTMEGINKMQYATKRGCRFYWTKLSAVFFSSLILGTIEVGFLMLMLKKNEAFSFMDCFVSGFQNPFITFAKMTFGQYVMFSVGYIVMIGLCLALVTYCLSSLARTYISAIAFQIPFIVFSMIVALLLMPHFAEITQKMSFVIVMPIICVIITACCNVIRFLSLRTHKKSGAVNK